MSHFKAIVFIVLGSLFIFSCKKDGSKPEIPNSEPRVNKIYLHDGSKWMLTDIIWIDTLNQDSSRFDSIPVCVTDDLFLFYEDSIYLISDGATYCGSTSYGSDASFWYWKGDSLASMGQMYDPNIEWFHVSLLTQTKMYWDTYDPCNNCRFKIERFVFTKLP